MKGKKEYSLMNEEGFNEAVKEAYTVLRARIIFLK
jgi:hypothetical protein